MVVLCLASVAPVAGAQSTGSYSEEMRRRVNSGTVRVVSGGMGSTAFRVATDLAAVLDGQDDLRILPMMGKGSLQNITDILYLRGVDIGIVQSDALTYVKQQGLHEAIERRISYIAPLYSEELHVLARSDVPDLRSLAGRKVNFGPADGGSYVTASTVFSNLGLDVQVSDFDQALALEKLKRREIDAMVFVTGKPATLFKDASLADGIRFLSIPQTPALRQIYLSSEINAKDYPNLMPAESRVETLAIDAVMVVFNWKRDTRRYRNIANFIDAFFSRMDALQRAPRHPKWLEVSVQRDIADWRRFRAAEDWLLEHGGEDKLFSYGELRDAVAYFLESEAPSRGISVDKAEDREMFRTFLRWFKAKPL